MSERETNDYAAFNRCMKEVKVQNMTYVEGPCFTVESLKEQYGQ